MAVVLAAAIYSRIGFSPCLAVRARHVMVPGGIVFHLEPETITTQITPPLFRRLRAGIVAQANRGEKVIHILTT